MAGRHLLVLSRDRIQGSDQLGSNFFDLFVPSWTKAAGVETAKSGFRETGMFPVNKNGVPKHACEPSKTSDQLHKLEVKFACSQWHIQRGAQRPRPPNL